VSGMIARHWRGLVKRDRAAAYVEHLQSETLPFRRDQEEDQ